MLHLADLGFQQISVEPVVGTEEETYALRAEDLPEVFAEYDRLAAEMVRRYRTGKASDRRTMCGQTAVRMRFRDRVSGSYALG